MQSEALAPVAVASLDRTLVLQLLGSSFGGSRARSCLPRESFVNSLLPLFNQLVASRHQQNGFSGEEIP
jgi:hypothetical protein